MRVRLVLIVVAGALPGCVLGPQFAHPAPPTTEAYTGSAQPAVTAEAGGAGGAAQHFISAAPVPVRWWEMFSCPGLNQLVQEALDHSPSVLEARARLREAREDLSADTGSRVYPALDAQLGVTREKFDPAVFGLSQIPPAPPFTLLTAQVNVSYSLDLFGADRRTLEGEHAYAEYQEYEAQAAQLSLAANVVAVAVRQAGLQAQLEATQQILATGEQQLAIAEARYAAGGVALEDLQDERTQVEQLRAALPPLRAQRQQTEHQLAVYTGRAPAQATTPGFTLDELQLPTELPLTLPSELVERRPDVRASEALWHQASANVGVASANLFPRLTISGSAASQRTRAEDIVDGFNVWSIGANLMQPIFHGGELRAKKRSALAAYDASAAAYEQTVLEALQQVADTLRALEADAMALQARAAAANAADASFGIAQQRYAAGGISELTLLEAKRQRLQTRVDRAGAQTQRYADTVALLHALAGGW